MRSTGRGLIATKTALALLLLGGVCACDYSHVPPPPTPPPGNQPSPGSGSYADHFFLSWNSTDLAQIATLTLSAPAGIQVVNAQTAATHLKSLPQVIQSRLMQMATANLDSLSLILPFDTQKDQHDEQVHAFEDEILKASKISGTTPEIRVPSQNCAVSNGQVSGICIHSLMVVLPAQKPISLDLTTPSELSLIAVSFQNLMLRLQAGTQATLTNTIGPIQVSGGAPDATLQLGPSQGDFSADLETVRSMVLNRLSGHVDLNVRDASGSQVSLDGTPIQSFPFHRQ